jgi:hypothetical protein
MPQAKFDFPRFDFPRFDFDVISQPAMPPPPPPPLAEADPGMAKSADPGHNPTRLNPPRLIQGRGDQR